jgi:hypothetical protein
MFDNSFHYTHFTGFMLEEEIVASLWDFGFKIPNSQNHRRHENLGKIILRRKGRKCIRLLIHWGVDIYLPKLNCGCNYP